MVMGNTQRRLPTPDEALLLHQKLSRGDLLASSDICLTFREFLMDWLWRRYPRIDEHFIGSAVNETLIDYLQHPDRYDPEKLELFSYLCMTARRDLSNLLRNEQRHHHGRESWNVVENVSADGNTLGGGDPAVPLEQAEEECRMNETLARLSVDWPEQERAVLDLMLRGERSTSVCADLLGIADRPFQEQQREVNKVKERIIKRLRRKGGRP
jgi:RNA polymerase sigma-70 factor, ECF subfamily